MVSPELRAVEDTRRYAADMGLKALKLATDLRADAGAPMPALDLEWSSSEYMENRQAKYAEIRQMRSDAVARVFGNAAQNGEAKGT